MGGVFIAFTLFLGVLSNIRGKYPLKTDAFFGKKLGLKSFENTQFFRQFANENANENRPSLELIQRGAIIILPAFCCTVRS